MAMEKQGVIRQGITPPETTEKEASCQSEKDLEAHTTTRLAIEAAECCETNPSNKKKG